MLASWLGKIHVLPVVSWSLWSKDKIAMILSILAKNPLQFIFD